eukprot:scaffold39061_cov33-Attheya_sp.AAC.1
MACSDDLDDSVAVEINFTVPGNTTWGPIGTSSPYLLPPLPIETKEDRRRRLKIESAARSYTIDPKSAPFPKANRQLKRNR